MNTPVQPFGDCLREWRQRRRLSQLDLAVEAGISTRHLSFLETGRSQPSRDMLLHLADNLDVPLRERNVLLKAAGFAPLFPERALEDPALSTARSALDALLAAHEPFPALVLDRHWLMVAANRAVAPLLAGLKPEMLQPPVNVLRLSLHPEGLAPNILNLAEWRGHLLDRLRRQIAATADPKLAELMDELRAYPAPRDKDHDRGGYAGLAAPLRLATPAGTLSFLSATTVFGTPLDVTLSELALETFLPMDAATTEALRGLAGTAA